jgi:GTPase SAR1 family protein
MDIKLIDDSSKEIKLEELLHDTSLKKIFLVGLPYSGKSELINEIKTNIKSKDGQPVAQNKIYEVNFITQWSKPAKLHGEEVLILKNFDHGINNHAINQRKLEWIQTAIDESASIIISCNSQPSAIIDFYELTIQRLPINDGPQKKQEYKQAIRLWKNILSGFVTYYQPLRSKKKIENAVYFVRTELEHGTYLPKLAYQLRHESTDTYAEQENFVMKVEELADTYYHSLWNSFSHDEKFLLYDLAKDRFVNLRNVKGIRLLLQKGIIVAGDSLQLMNKSFNDFILHVVNEDEEIKMQHELNQKGSWNAVYTVLIILLFGLMVFIMLAQQNLLNDINLMLGVLGSIAAIFTRFGGLLGSSKKEQA